MWQEKIKECLIGIKNSNNLALESLNRKDFEAFSVLAQSLELVLGWGVSLKEILEKEDVELSIFVRAEVLVRHCLSLAKIKVAEKLAVIISISAECEFLEIALQSEKYSQRTPLSSLNMSQIAYSSLVWSLQEFSPEDFVDALLEQKQTVFERYGEITEVANLPLPEILRLQEELKFLQPSQVVDIQLAFGHFFVVLFGEKSYA